MNTFSISTEVKDLGLKGTYFRLDGIVNREYDPTFDTLRDNSIAGILTNLTEEAIENDPILAGFRELHAKVGVSNRKHVSSPENLLRLLLRNGTLPRINLIVDIYNLVSVETRLALGAHDISTVQGNVSLRLTDGTERFQPLGSDEMKPVGAGEYAYVDDSNEVICRLETRQVEKTKVTSSTTECFYIVQGNAATDDTYIKKTSNRLIELTQQFCGGTYTLLDDTSH